MGKTIIRNTVNRLILFSIFCTISFLFIRCETSDYPYYIHVPGDVSFSVIIDGSGSMSSILPEVKQCLNSLLDAMDEDDRMQFIQSGLPPILLNDWSHDKEELRASIDKLAVSGDNERYELAVEYAISNTTRETLHCILLFGDGDIYYEGEPNEETVLTSIRNSVENDKVVIYTFGIGAYIENTLASIADAGKGEMYVIDNPNSFGEKYKEIRDNLKSNYYN